MHVTPTKLNLLTTIKTAPQINETMIAAVQVVFAKVPLPLQKLS